MNKMITNYQPSLVRLMRSSPEIVTLATENNDNPALRLIRDSLGYTCSFGKLEGEVFKKRVSFSLPPSILEQASPEDILRAEAAKFENFARMITLIYGNKIIYKGVKIANDR